MDITKALEPIIAKLKDPDTLESFKKDPVKTIENMTGIDLPDESIETVVAAVKAKLASADIASKLGGLFK